MQFSDAFDLVECPRHYSEGTIWKGFQCPLCRSLRRVPLATAYEALKKQVSDQQLVNTHLQRQVNELFGRLLVDPSGDGALMIDPFSDD